MSSQTEPPSTRSRKRLHLEEVDHEITGYRLALLLAAEPAAAQDYFYSINHEYDVALVCGAKDMEVTSAECCARQRGLPGYGCADCSAAMIMLHIDVPKVVPAPKSSYIPCCVIGVRLQRM